MPGKSQPDSENSIAARLTQQLGREVTRQCVREWKKKGWDLTKPAQIEKRLRMQERAPKRIRPAVDPAAEEAEPEDDGSPPPEIEPDLIGPEIAKLQKKLTRAKDYEESRTITSQLAGLKHAFALHKEMGLYVTRESQERIGLRDGQFIKQLILKIPSELPQMLVGLDYPDALQKCEQYADGILSQIATLDDED
jgi:hypothetical protein